MIKYFNIAVISHERQDTSFYFEHGHLFINVFVVTTMITPKFSLSQNNGDMFLCNDVTMGIRHVLRDKNARVINVILL